MAAKMDIYNYSSDQALNQVTMDNCDANNVDDLVYWVEQSDGNESSGMLGPKKPSAVSGSTLTLAPSNINNLIRIIVMQKG
tara:strand:- start:169 stop:411 length:243 start_codon:yes stop_codon:yes gene_type:complete